MTRITVSEPVLRWALERSCQRANLEGKFPKLPEWLSGSGKPTLHQLEDLAKATSTPLGYFFPNHRKSGYPFLISVRLLVSVCASPVPTSLRPSR
jgi:hypothetical protein